MIDYGATNEDAYIDKQEVIMDQMNLKSIPNFLVTPSSHYHITVSLDISSNLISQIPSAFFYNFPNLQALILKDNKLTWIPDNIVSLKFLKTIKLDNNLLKVIPSNICQLESLEILSISYNKLMNIPANIASLKNCLWALNISNNLIAYLPEEICALTNLAELQIQNNSFDSIPCNIIKLTKLKVFNLEWVQYNTFTKNNTDSFSIVHRVCQYLLAVNISTCSFIQLMEFYQFDQTQLHVIEPRSGYTYLHKAAYENHIGVLQAFIAKYPKCINMLDFTSATPLCIAIDRGNIEAAKILINLGADVNMGNVIFGTPLNLAVSKFDIPLINLLINKGAKTFEDDFDTLNSPLHTLLTKFHYNPYKAAIIGEILLNSGTKPNTKNRQGWAPIHLAAKKGEKAAIRWITRYNRFAKEKGFLTFDLDASSATAKFTALHLAAHAGYSKIACELIKAGADLFAKNIFNKTPRQMAKGHLCLYKQFRKTEKDIILNYLLESYESAYISPEDKLKRLETFADNVSTALRTKIDEFDPKNNTQIPQTARASIGKSITLLPEKKEETNKNQFSEKPRTLTCIKDFKTKDLKKEIQSNVYFLKDQILSNGAPLYERFKSLRNLTKYRNKRSNNKYKAIKQIFDNLESIDNRSLQIAIISNTAEMHDIPMLELFENLLMQVKNKFLIYELKNAIVKIHENIKRNLTTKTIRMSNKINQVYNKNSTLSSDSRKLIPREFSNKSIPKFNLSPI